MFAFLDASERSLELNIELLRNLWDSTMLGMELEPLFPIYSFYSLIVYWILIELGVCLCET